MTGIIATIGSGVLTSVIYDVSKYVIGKLSDKQLSKEKEKKLKNLINDKLNVGVSATCQEILELSTFAEYLNSSRFLDVINAYLECKIITDCFDQNAEIRKYIHMNGVISTTDVLNYLSENIYQLFIFNKPLIIPEKKDIYATLNHVLKVCEKVIVSSVSTEHLTMLYFINSRFDKGNEKIINAISELKNILINIQKIQLSNQVDVGIFEQQRKKYHDILKEKNSEAHIYLLDKFPFASFYVAPILKRLNKSQLEVIYSRQSGFSNIVSWNDIFSNNNIIYLTGGAGYGKSLFAKKIINDYQNLNIFRAEEYIVIYGELKSFYNGLSETPMSVIDFLKNSIRSNTLIDVTSEFVQFYLDEGRCIILLDALDEVEKTKRASLHETVTSFFKKQNPNNKICITSRERGFIPEKNIEVLNICPLNKSQIEKYVDKIIALGKFEPKDKTSFLKQTEKLVEKKFLNSFLVLSLLINIYKAERELPENKLELYQKCFDYIAKKREKEKTDKAFDWTKISPLMKDNTFIELSRMCLPNNSNVDKDRIKDKLLKVYKTKYCSEAETEYALDEFLKFCAERTELFVPSVEDNYKFFHRSFFEYFCSQYITLRIHSAEERLKELLTFDVDSEVFELTVGMLKQHSEDEYQELIDLMFERTDVEFKSKKYKFAVFNILILSMQVVDDVLYRERFSQIIIEQKDIILRNEMKLANLNIIADIFKDSDDICNKICEAYEKESLLTLLKNCTTVFEAIDNAQDTADANILEKTPTEIGLFVVRRINFFERKDHWRSFHVKLFTQIRNCLEIFLTISDDAVYQIYRNFRANNYKKPAQATIDALNKFRDLPPCQQKNALDLILKYFID